MKVKFPDEEFGVFEPHGTVEYNRKSYRTVTVSVTRDDGVEESHTIADKDLETALAKEYGNVGDINCNLDDSISYYAQPQEGLYFIMEQILGEEVK